MSVELVEHGFNKLGEVVVFLASLPGEPLSWRPEGASGLWIRQPGHLDRRLGLSPDVRGMADKAGAIILVEVDSEERRTTRVTKLSMVDD